MKHRVLNSLQNRAADHCVDIFVRADGSYGYEEYRRDAEDTQGWFSLHRHAQRVFASEAAALAEAQATVAWLVDPS